MRKNEFMPFLDKEHFRSDPKRIPAIVQAMARCLATFLTIRFEVHFKENGKDPTLVELMYSGGNPIYALNPALQQIVKDLYSSLRTAKSCLLSAKRLQRVAHDACVLHNEDPHANSGNVALDLVEVQIGSYVRQLECQCASFTCRPLRMGGLGALLREQLKVHAAEWLAAIDALVCKHFDLPLGDEYDKKTMESYVLRYAALIGARVSMLDFAWKQSTKLSAALCSQTCKCQFVRNELVADEQVKKDVASMRLLIALCREPRDSATVWAAVTSGREDVLSVLLRPPHELLHAFPKIQRDMQLHTLADAFSNPLRTSEELIESMLEWRSAVNADGLVNALELAVHEALRWVPTKSYFIQAIRFLDAEALGTVEANTMLPLMRWIHWHPEQASPKAPQHAQSVPTQSVPTRRAGGRC